jgi:hypothetical protein
VAGKGDDKSGVVEAADGDFKVLRRYFRFGEEAFDVVAPGCVLGCR